ncbi:MAG: SOS response-associated peptidase [Thermomicrobiales bacterium]
MCGRYSAYDLHLLGQILTNAPLDLGMAPHPTWNAAPSQILPVLVESPDEERVELTGMSWGLVPRWAKPGEKPRVAPINARAETLTQKPMFRSLVRGHRCIVPANGFYEWKHEDGGKGPKQPYYIHLRDEPMMFFAGLYDEAVREDGSPIQTYTIITTEANDAMHALHDRMPVIVPPDDVEHWLSRSETDFDALDYVLKPAPDDAVEMHPVSKAVNSPANDSPDLIEPLEDVEQPGLF